MNWKVIAIVLIVVVVLVGAYSIGFFQQGEEVANDGTSTTAESLDFSASVQSDFWDGFNEWIWANLLYICIVGLLVWGVTSFVKSR